ncbi:hypothetical protein BKA66DRAFT_288422 [Pyrenochaeta sp. MPI-SDFR-AT-0127]|nr:hypothetical protein BKA66DRAFT_288422 [Pyrenochaeta sp. MPI-SDFR-AT-0127]
MWQNAVKSETNHEKTLRPCSPLVTDVADGHEAVTDCYVAVKMISGFTCMLVAYPAHTQALTLICTAVSTHCRPLFCTQGWMWESVHGLDWRSNPQPHQHPSSCLSQAPTTVIVESGSGESAHLNSEVDADQKHATAESEHRALGCPAATEKHQHQVRESHVCVKALHFACPLQWYSSGPSRRAWTTFATKAHSSRGMFIKFMNVVPLLWNL